MKRKKSFRENFLFRDHFGTFSLFSRKFASICLAKKCEIFAKIENAKISRKKAKISRKKAKFSRKIIRNFLGKKAREINSLHQTFMKVKEDKL